MFITIIILKLSTDWYCVRDPLIFGSSYIINMSYDIQVVISTQVILELVKVLDIYDLSFCVLLLDDRSIIVRHSSSARPKSTRVQKWAGKVLAPFFGDQDGILLIDYLPKGQTINPEYYWSLLVQLEDILKEKRRGKFTKGVLFLHDNAPAHSALATQKKLAYLEFQCLDHPPYSPDLAPSDYHLFPGLKKKQLKVRHFSSDAEVIAAAETWLDGQTYEFFFEWLAKVRATG